MPSAQVWAGIGSVLGFILGLFSMTLSNHATITLWMNKIQDLFSPYIEITIPEYDTEHLKRSDMYVAIEAYLSDKCATGVRKLKAEVGSHTKSPLFYVQDGQQMTDTYRSRDGREVCKIWWHAYKEKPAAANVNYRPGEEERRFYRVSFHRKFRKTILEEYLPHHVIKHGRDVIATNRQRRLYTNNANNLWSHVAFQHPATFDTLAMDRELKLTVLDDLKTFRSRKEYYRRVGRPWKRGYLLYGPPGTGKSTMVSAMANYLDYDIYDLDLTAVKSNNDLRRLFIDTTGNSITVVEDINRFGGRHGDNKNKGVVNMQPTTPEEKHADKDDGSQQVTLSGLLNLIDGLWSARDGEHIIVFITNNKDKLDPALVRPGRMDMHIEMSYCTYEVFKVLANCYLNINELDDFFEWFGEIHQLLDVVEMSPADVAAHLMRIDNDADACLEGLVAALRAKKEESIEKMEAVEAE